MERCGWQTEDPLYVTYHDTEWGKPVYEDQKLFEFLVLESAQAGLSWITILRKREAYHKQYEGFDPAKVALFDEDKINEMLLDAGIVRNRLKVTSSIRNAQLFLEIQKEFGSFSNYLWGYTGHQVVDNTIKKLSDMPVSTPLSDSISKDLKKRGFKFVGSTIIYAYLQAVGVVNDHTATCSFR